MGMPSSVATIWLKVVTCDWPCGWAPTVTLTSPVGWTIRWVLAQTLPIKPSWPIRGDGPTPATAT